MLEILHLLATFVGNLFRSRRRLEIENLFLRHQLNIAMRRAPRRLRLHGSDRALLVWITRVWPNLLDLSRVVKPETILRWHRSGFKAFWRWKFRHRAGRPKIDRELRDLIRQMSKDNPLWGAPRIHGELLKLGSISARPRWQSTWRREGGHRRRVGRRSFAIMPMALWQWISALCRQSGSNCSMVC